VICVSIDRPLVVPKVQARLSFVGSDIMETSMQIRSLAVIALGVVTLTAAPAFAAIPSDKAEPHTAAAVEAADQAWGDAESNGDKAYVDWLLLPGYQSVGEAGKSADKAMIVGSVSAAHSAERKAKVDAWKATHSEKPVVTIVGDTAVLAWTSTKPDAAVMSCDVFAYKDGHWHAVYSQHTTAGD
jgi:hypothetical protein